MAAVTVAVEGLTDVPVVRRMLEQTGHTLHVTHGGRGKGELDRSLNGYNSAARFAPWLVLRDLDHDADCAPELIADLLAAPSTQMCFRVAVREMEAWLLADSVEIARFLGVRQSVVPMAPDELDDPKQALVNLARGSRLRSVREDMVPAAGTSSVVGPAYSSRIDEFATKHWRPMAAAASSPSLRRALDRLQTAW